MPKLIQLISFKFVGARFLMWPDGIITDLGGNVHLNNGEKMLSPFQGQRPLKDCCIVSHNRPGSPSGIIWWKFVSNDWKIPVKPSLSDRDALFEEKNSQELMNESELLPIQDENGTVFQIERKPNRIIEFLIDGTEASNRRDPKIGDTVILDYFSLSHRFRYVGEIMEILPESLLLVKYQTFESEESTMLVKRSTLLFEFGTWVQHI